MNEPAIEPAGGVKNFIAGRSPSNGGIIPWFTIGALGRTQRHIPRSVRGKILRSALRKWPERCATRGGESGGRPALAALRFHPPDGVADEGGGILQVELLLNVAAVHVDRFGAKIELRGNIPGAFSRANQLEHLKLAVG